MSFGSNERTVDVRDPVGASVGDEVQIGIPSGPVIWASIVAYVIPVVGMLIGAVVGYHLGPGGQSDEMAAVGCFGALALCFGAIFLYDRTQRGREDRTPVVVRVLRAAPATETAECVDDL